MTRIEKRFTSIHDREALSAAVNGVCEDEHGQPAHWIQPGTRSVSRHQLVEQITQPDLQSVVADVDAGASGRPGKRSCRTSQRH